ncbi:hypothetical protein [Halomonas sp. C05BenzN]|jgi:hypothetical protein|uniref:hypothetical protein n=1 Tax=Halomonas sp. C05BenzN TaxID=3411041 RepID=UPI003B95F489
MSHAESLVDYSESFQAALIAQGKGSNFLSLTRLDEPYERFDGKRASYELNYRWLSTDCQEEDDQAWACVQGAECTYWQHKEITKLLRQLKRHDDVDLFEHFDLFG